MGFLSDLIENRTERIQARQERRAERAEMRNETRQAAYAAGFDPNKSIGDFVKSATDITKSYFSPAGAAGASAAATPTATPPPSTGMSAIPTWGWIAGAAAIFLLMRKK